MTAVFTLFGLLIAAGSFAAIVWSAAVTARRIWPPKRYHDVLTPVLVWAPTFALAGILLWLGAEGWGAIPLPGWLRWGVGVPVIVLANLAVWSEAARFGARQTGGDVGPLRTQGLYRRSRNPQYLADAAMILGWLALSASPAVAVVGSATIAVLAAAPFAEEPWLAERHSDDWHDYSARVRRYF